MNGNDGPGLCRRTSSSSTLTGHIRARRHWLEAFVWAYSQSHNAKHQTEHVANVAEIVVLLQRFSGEHLLHFAHSPTTPPPPCICRHDSGPPAPCGIVCKDEILPPHDERTPLLPGAEARPAGRARWRRFFARESTFIQGCVVLLACLMCIGPAHEYDVVGALEAQVEQVLQITPTRFAWLYMIYPIPNIVLVFLGGVAIDLFGLRGSSLVFSGCVALGGVTVAIGLQMRSFVVTLVGRVIYAMGSETTYIIKSAILMKWFPGNSRAISLSVSFIRLGSVFAFTGSSAVANLMNSKILAPAWFAASSCLLCFVSALVYVTIDVTTERAARRGAGTAASRPRPSLRAALQLPPRYWALMTCGVALYSAVWPFQSYSTRFLKTMYGMDVNQARWVTSIIPFMSLTLSLPAGWLVDRVFKHHLLVLLSCMVAVPCFALQAALPSVPATAYVSYTFIGLLFTLYVSSLFPAIAVIVDPGQFGVAYGLTAAGINLGLFASYQVVGLISEHGGGPKASLLYYTFWTLVSCVAALAWCLLPNRAPAGAASPAAPSSKAASPKSKGLSAPATPQAPAAPAV